MKFKLISIIFLLFAFQNKASSADESASEGNIPPKRINHVNVMWPFKAVALKREGKVVVKFTINANGGVEDPVVIEAEPKGVFEREALATVLKLRFAPAMSKGQPIKQVATQTIEFKFENEPTDLSELNYFKNISFRGIQIINNVIIDLNKKTLKYPTYKVIRDQVQLTSDIKGSKYISSYEEIAQQLNKSDGVFRKTYDLEIGRKTKPQILNNPDLKIESNTGGFAVKFKAKIDKTGKIKNIGDIKYNLTTKYYPKAVIDALEKVAIFPAMSKGKPVNSSMEILFSFDPRERTINYKYGE